jgi:hypothetical protein
MSVLSPVRAGSKSPQPPPATILINGIAYGLARLAAHADVAARAFRLTKPDGTTYDVAQRADGVCSCECLGHLRWSVACKHIRALKAARLLA